MCDDTVKKSLGKAFVSVKLEPKEHKNKKKEEDVVNSPAHYNMLDIEAIDLIEMSMTSDEFQGYLKGNAMKYIIRYKHKGKPKQDIAKGLWYLKRLEGKIDE